MSDKAKDNGARRGISEAHDKRAKELQGKGMSRSAAGQKAFRDLVNKQQQGGNG